MKCKRLLRILINLMIMFLIFSFLCSCSDEESDSSTDSHSYDDDDDGRGESDDDSSGDDDMAAGLGFWTVDDDDETPGYDLNIPDADDDDDDIPQGPFPVGNKTFVLQDESRYDPATKGPRTLVVEVWYPSTEESLDMPRDILLNFLAPWEDEILDFALGLGVSEEELENFNLETDSARDSPFLTEKSKYPLIIFSHGNGSVRYQNFTQCIYLASQGFIVVSPNHTGNSMAAPIPDQLVVYNDNMAVLAVNYRPRDVSFLIDQFTGVDSNPDLTEFVEAVDTDRIAVGGMSFGAYTCTEAAKHDSRIKAVFPMAFPMLPGGFRHYDAATLYSYGTEDRTIGEYGFLFDFGYQLTPAPKYSLAFLNAGHYSFTDVCIFLPTLAGYQDGCGYGERMETGEPFTFIEHDKLFDLMNSYLMAFLYHYLYNDLEAGEYLTENHDPDEIEFQIEE